MLSKNSVPDPPPFVSDLQDANKKYFFLYFFCLLPYFMKVYLHHSSKIISHKEVTKSRIKGFSYYFSLIMEGSGIHTVPLTNGSGSGMPKTLRIIRIRYTV